MNAGWYAWGILLLASASQGANILALFPVAEKSHIIFITSLLKELASRGHHVTAVNPSPSPMNSPNYKNIEVHFDIKSVSTVPVFDNLFDMRHNNIHTAFSDIWTYGALSCTSFLQHPEVQKLIHSKDQHFDLVIVEASFNDCLLGFAHKFDAPVIQICPFGGTHWMGDSVGNPNPYSFVPDPFLEYTHNMNFLQRAHNALVGTFVRFGHYFYHLPIQQDIIHKYFNHSDSMPSIYELQSRTSLFLLNHHFSLHYPKPLMPSMIPVGGMHIKTPQKLPQDLQKFLDESKDGVVYFCMGSHLESSRFPEETRDAFLKAFKKLKQRVLWKWEVDSLPGQPPNLKLGKWLPQQDILAHPNVVAFITHGGLLGSQEAVHRGVPVVGIPIFGDQMLNMARAVDGGYGITLHFDNITEESVSWALDQVINTPSYRENVKRLSAVFRDEPHLPLHKAVFWTEYVLRHKGAPQLRSAAVDLAWYQYFLLDIVLVFGLAAVVAVLVLYLTLKTLLKMCCGKKKSPVKKSQPVKNSTTKVNKKKD